jgi:CheY-like chemotaxis protein
MPFPEQWRASWGVTEMGHPGSAALDDRPMFRVADFGLDQRLLTHADTVLRHARHNPYRYELASNRQPGGFDIAMVDMTAAGAPQALEDLRGHALAPAPGGVAAAPAIVRVGRRADEQRGQDELPVNAFTHGLIPALNRAVEHSLLSSQGPSARFGAASGRAQAPGAVAAPVAGAQAGAAATQPSGAQPQAAESDDPDDAPSARRPRVLVVDDSPTVRRQLAVALHRMGLDSEGVNSAREALETLAVRHYEMVFVDVVMPEMDGYRLTREIKRSRTLRPMPVVILTSRSSPFDLARGALAGCDSYLVKPVSMQSLRETVARHLHRAGPPSA